MTSASFFPTTALVSLFLALALAPLSSQEAAKTAATQAPAQPAPRTVKESFNTMEVDLFENQKDSNFPAKYLAPLQKEIVKKLVSAKVFAEVVTAGQPASTPNPRVIRLTGLITNYNPGSRAARWLGGGGGNAELNSKIVFVDAATGQPLMSQDLRAVLTGGGFGGKSEDVIKDYAHQVVNKVKLMQNMRIPAPREGPTPIVAATGGPAPSSAPAQHTVLITDEDWPASEQKLNQEAADGYRLTGLTITGRHTADAALVRTYAIAETFQYKLPHTFLVTNLQKDINKLATEGFRVSPNTLVVLGNNPVVVMEKSTPPFKSSYQYIVKETQLISSGQKDIEQVQNQGYTLIGETEHRMAHLLLFEKSSPAP
jgi:hypothetical protein